MKLTELKKIIKSAVKEAIQEELKDILLEAVRTPKQQIITQPIKESNNIEVNAKRKQITNDILNEMKNKFSGRGNSEEINFNTGNLGNVNPMSDELPEGSVGMDTIMNLMGGKK